MNGTAEIEDHLNCGEYTDASTDTGLITALIRIITEVSLGGPRAISIIFQQLLTLLNY